VDTGGKEYAEQMLKAAAVLAPRGWALFGNWDYSALLKLVALRDGGAQGDELDNYATEVWNQQRRVLLHNIAAPLRRYGRFVDLNLQRQCQIRANIVDQAVQCHEQGLYAASITLVLAQIDGLTRDLTGASFFRFNPGVNEYSYVSDSTLATVGATLPTVRRQFSDSVDSTGMHGSLSRHGVMHGRDLAFATLVNSTKTLVLLGSLIEQLEEQGSKKAKKIKRQSELQKSKLEGFDESGRLLDDRGLEQLYLFRADIETYVHMRILENDLARNSFIDHVRERLRERQLSYKSFYLNEISTDRTMWTFRSPGGQYLASAFCIENIEVRPVSPQRWTWDSPDAPSSGPWDDSIGWSLNEDDPTSPNWRFGGFPAGQAG
jgi:hypothetical protein